MTASPILKETKAQAQAQEKGPLEPFFEFLDHVDFCRASIKTDVSNLLDAFFGSNYEIIAKLMIREAQKQDGKAAKEINRLVIPRITTIAAKYYDAALEAGDKFARDIILAMRKIRKGLGWVSSEYKADEGKLARKIIRENEQQLVATLDANTKRYVVSTSQWLGNMLLNNVPKAGVKETVEAEIKERKRETGTFFRETVADTQGQIFKAADSAAHYAFNYELEAEGKSEEKIMWRWVTFFTRSCPDCVDRHDKVWTYPEWEMIGVPRTGTTVCRSHCHCVLVPDEYDTQTRKPAQRERAKIEPEKPKEVKPEKPKEVKPEKPKEPKPEKPKEPKPEKPKEPKPEKPKEVKPEKPKEPKPEKPKETRWPLRGKNILRSKKMRE